MAQGGLTDNSINGAVLAKGGTTRFPACALLAELALTMEEKRLQMDVEWVPRELNSEADRLANGVCEAFDESRRRHIDLANHPWRVLPGLLSHGAELSDMRKSARLAHRGARRRRRSDRLRAVDPW